MVFEWKIQNRRNILDTNNNTEKVYLKDNLSAKIKYSGSIYNGEIYKDGNLLYSYFTQILKNDIKQLIKFSLKFELLKIIDTKENIIIMDKAINITIDKKTGIPIRQKEKYNGNNNDMPTIQFVEAEFNCVRDEDIVDICEK